MKKLLFIQPHSDDFLFSAAHALFLPGFEIEVLTVESDPKRVKEDRAFFNLLEKPVHHLDLKFKDESYYHHFNTSKYKYVNDENAYQTLEAVHGRMLMNEIRRVLTHWIHNFMDQHGDYEVVAPLGIGHPFHLFIRDIVRRAASNVYYYREFPHSHKKRSRTQIIETEDAGYRLHKIYATHEWDDLRWDLARTFYKSQSSLLYFEQGYIAKQLPEEIWVNENDHLPF